MKRLKFITGAFFIALSLFFLAGKAEASEGTFELTSRTATQTSCFASSVLLQNFQYKILVSCQNLVYPAPNGAFAYILWANPQVGGNPIKLGSVGFGKALFTTKVPFQTLFLTSEIDDKAKTPSQYVVAQGSLQPLTYLQGRISPELALESVLKPTEPAENFGEIIEEATPTAQLQPSSRGGLLAIFEKGGIAFAIGVFVILIIIAFITRSKG